MNACERLKLGKGLVTEFAVLKKREEPNNNTLNVQAINGKTNIF
jgi:hypothetical protein